MIYVMAQGSGGNGGNGAVGAASAAAGGGGGGAGSRGIVLLSAWGIPDRLFVRATTTQAAVAVETSFLVQEMIIAAFPGGNGGNASAGTPGTAGAISLTPSASRSSLHTFGATVFGGGNTSVAGGTLAGTPYTPSLNGNIATPGAGGAGVGAAAGQNGGDINASGVFYRLPGGIGGATTTAPGGRGQDGPQRIVAGLPHGYGGSGGGSSHGTAVGAGLFGGNGGDGALGSGGGGGGGCLTGGVAGVGGRGGDAFVLIIAM